MFRAIISSFIRIKHVRSERFANAGPVGPLDGIIIIMIKLDQALIKVAAQQEQIVRLKQQLAEA
jgi:hypothetical protein